MSNREKQSGCTRRDFLKVSSSLIGMRFLGLALPPGAAILSGCTQKRSSEELARRIIVALERRIQTLDPAYQTMALDSFVIANIYDPLTWYNRELEFIPRLALSWETPDDALTWIFKLRPDVKFHDGTEFNADAVKFHFDRIKDPATNSKRQTKVAKLDSVDVIDNLTVRFNMNEPYSVWPVVLRDGFAGVVSPTAVRKYGNEEFTLHAIGTGPYKVLEHEPGGDRVILTKNHDYWDADNYGVEEVEFRAVGEPTTRLILLEQNAIDLTSITFAHTDVAKDTDKIEVINTPYLAVRYIGFNNMKPPFNDPRVRHAANMGVNREEIVKYAFRENADPLLGPLPSQLPAFNKEMKTWDYDPEQAKKLLAEAGYPNGVDVKLWTMDDIGDTNLGVVVADQLRNIGIRIEIIRYDRNVYWTQFDPFITRKGEWFPTKEGVFDMFASGWVGGEHPHSYLDPLFRSNSSSNSSFYKNDDVNNLLLASMSTGNDEKRNEIYQQLQQIIVQDAPWIFCYSSRIIWGVNPRVKNMFVHPAGEYEFHGVQLGGTEGLA